VSPPALSHHTSPSCSCPPLYTDTHTLRDRGYGSRHIHRQADREIDRWTDRRMHRQTDRQRDREIDGQIDR